jgi:hypothetical protein
MESSDTPVNHWFPSRLEVTFMQNQSSMESSDTLVNHWKTKPPVITCEICLASLDPDFTLRLLATASRGHVKALTNFIASNETLMRGSGQQQRYDSFVHGITKWTRGRGAAPPVRWSQRGSGHERWYHTFVLGIIQRCVWVLVLCWFCVCWICVCWICVGCLLLVVC